jgi:sec-independent protein translocase protein TatA
MMFFLGTLGPMELVLILLVVLIIFGAGRIPEIGEGLGKGIRSFKRAVSEDDSKKLPKVEEKKEIPGGETKE